MLLALKILIALFVILVVILLIAGFLRTWQMEHSALEQAFLAGKVPDPAPNGLYAGDVPGLTTSWRGKSFDAANSSGINVLDAGNGSTREAYPFTTSVGTGVRDGGLQVLRIDYDIPQNSLWLRSILDEVVQVAPGQLLGKMQLRIIPGYPVTLLYFTLKQS